MLPLVFALFLPGGVEPVYTVEPAIDASVIGGSLAASIVPYALSGTLITPRCPCDPNQVNAFDRHVIGNRNLTIDTFSDLQLALSLLAPIALDALDTKLSKTMLDDLVIEGEAVAVTGALTTLAKYIVQRPLPVVYANQELVQSPGGYRSFFSGHTALAGAALAAAATTYVLRHDQKIWPWFIVAAGVISIGAERVLAGRHFYTDVIVGGVVGVSAGIAVPLLHTRF